MARAYTHSVQAGTPSSPAAHKRAEHAYHGGVTPASRPASAPGGTPAPAASWRYRTRMTVTHQLHPPLHRPGDRRHGRSFPGPPGLPRGQGASPCRAATAVRHPVHRDQRQLRAPYDREHAARVLCREAETAASRHWQARAKPPRFLARWRAAAASVAISCMPSSCQPPAIAGSVLFGRSSRSLPFGNWSALD